MTFDFCTIAACRGIGAGYWQSIMAYFKCPSFGRSQPWSDRLGKHTIIEIRNGTGPAAPVVGKITGESGVGIPMMQYTVECEGIPTFTTFSLKDAKAGVQARWQNQ